MGLAATQVRLLQLTSRQHRIEYQAQKIQAQKLQLSNESDLVYNAYMNALDSKKVQYKYVETDGSVSYVDATLTKMFGGYNVGIQTPYALEITNGQDNDGKYYVSDSVFNSYNANKTNKTGFVNACCKNAADEAEVAYYENLFEIISTGKGVEKFPTAYADDYEWLTNMLANGYVMLHKWDVEAGDDNQGAWVKESVATDLMLQEVSDDKELKKAEAVYEAETTRINKKDAKYDTILSQTETERTAIKTEMDSLKQVRNDNIDKAFKLFS